MRPAHSSGVSFRPAVALFTSYFHGLETAAQETTQVSDAPRTCASKSTGGFATATPAEVTGRNVASAMRGIDCFIASNCTSTTTNRLGVP